MALAPDTTRSDLDRRYATGVSNDDDLRTVAVHKVAWGAIFAGAVIALVVQVILNMVGLGIGLSTVDPAGNGTPTAGSLSSSAGIWFVVSGILASAAGGWLAGRLAGKPALLTGGLHGLVSWAVSTLVVVYLLSSAVGGVASGAFSAVTSTLGGTGSFVGGSVKTAAQAAAPSLPGMDNPFSNIEGQVRANTSNDPQALKDAAVTAVRAAMTGDAAQQADAQEKAAQALAKAQNEPVEQAPDPGRPVHPAVQGRGRQGEGAGQAGRRRHRACRLAGRALRRSCADPRRHRRLPRRTGWGQGSSGGSRRRRPGRPASGLSVGTAGSARALTRFGT